MAQKTSELANFRHKITPKSLISIKLQFRTKDVGTLNQNMHKVHAKPSLKFKV